MRFFLTETPWACNSLICDLSPPPCALGLVEHVSFLQSRFKTARRRQREDESATAPTLRASAAAKCMFFVLIALVCPSGQPVRPASRCSMCGPHVLMCTLS
ncbi:hypothetical protein FA95DRAFT_1566286, partial [Auriscalpium vulgare]